MWLSRTVGKYAELVKNKVVNSLLVQVHQRVGNSPAPMSHNGSHSQYGRDMPHITEPIRGLPLQLELCGTLRTTPSLREPLLEAFCSGGVLALVRAREKQQTGQGIDFHFTSTDVHLGVLYQPPPPSNLTGTSCMLIVSTAAHDPQASTR